jgi:hypothetical protein
MSDELNRLLKKAYYRYKDCDNSPVPINIIKEFLELEGVSIEDGMKKDSQNTDLKSRKYDRGC